MKHITSRLKYLWDKYCYGQPDSITYDKWLVDQSPMAESDKPGPVEIRFPLRNLMIINTAGHQLNILLDDFPQLFDSMHAQRMNYYVFHCGDAIYWPELNFGLDVPALIEVY
jgi:hypothetical protein